MTDTRDTKRLVRLSWLLAITGVVIFVAASVFLAALYRATQLNPYESTYVVLATAPAVGFSCSSLVALAGSCYALFRSRVTGSAVAGRLAIVAILTTLAAWLAVALSFFTLTAGGGAA